MTPPWMQRRLDRKPLPFSGTPDVGFPLQREVRDIPAEIVRRVWNQRLRDYETPYPSGDDA